MSKLDKKKIAIVVEAGCKNPRPYRLAQHLKKDHNVVFFCVESCSDFEYEVVSFDVIPLNSQIARLKYYYNLFTLQFEKILKSRRRLRLAELLKEREFDFIFCHDITLLPTVIENKKGAKVIFDAREYYPRQFEHSLKWKILNQQFKTWLCKNYLDKPDYFYTVSEGLSDEYHRVFGRKPDIFHSYPEFYDLEPSLVDAQSTRIIYHGSSSPGRKIEFMIEMMDYVDDRFSLDLMLVRLVRSNDKYYKKLEEMCSLRKNVKIIQPVEFENIVTFINMYDIGIFLVPPTTFNLEFSLPNKFFEYVQARLAIAIGPSIEMKRFVDKYEIGIVSKDFSPKAMADSLSRLTKEQIDLFKNNSHKAAKELSMISNEKKIEYIIDLLIGKLV